jgi:cell wall-associated NlpC family hydrolase
MAAASTPKWPLQQRVQPTCRTTEGGLQRTGRWCFPTAHRAPYLGGTSMRTQLVVRLGALVVASALAVAGAVPTPASAAPPPEPVQLVPGDSPLPSYPGLPLRSAQPALAAVTTTPVPCDNNGDDKTLTRADVLTRARSWLGVGIPYSQSRCYRNQYGDYRTDCSGFVSMAWGLGGSGSAFWTGNLLDRSGVIARADLQPGDALLRHTGDPNENHVALFVAWADSGHTQPNVIEQTGSSGTVQDTWSASYASLYTPIRYDHITEGSGSNAVPDIDGNGKADILAVYNTGELMWYPNYDSSGTDANFLAPRQVSAAGGFRLMSLGDVNGDGLADIMAVYFTGELVWYPNAGGGRFLAARQISAAGGFRLMSLGDIDGNHFADIVAVYNSGELVWYPNAGGGQFLAARQISAAGGFRLMGLGDIDGNHLADIVAVYNSGELVWYPNAGGGRFLAARQISAAGNFRLMSLGDINGDGFGDILAVYNSGELVWYPNAGGGGGFLAARLISAAGGFRLMAD